MVSGTRKTCCLPKVKYKNKLWSYILFIGVKSIKKQKVRKDLTKIVVEEERDEKCPRFNQIRYLASFSVAATGPNGARALSRKLLGNEEYCIHIDAHTSFISDWDAIVKTEWKQIKNEFAVISTMPANQSEISSYDSWTGNKKGEVPHQCRVRIADNDIPVFPQPADGYAVGLEKPLLGYTWSSAFSFSKCHLEETVPYDPFTQYVFGAEQFARYARMWTRGYDVYTPTKNIVYHDYDPNPNGHGIQEWFKKRREKVRQQSLLRTKTFLGITSGEGIKMDVAHANLGVYGLGKRRSLKQLQEFMGIDLASRSGNKASMNCGRKTWIPYDASISPMEYLYDKATDLDPQPIFPMREKFIYFVETEQEIDNFIVFDGDSNSDSQGLPSLVISTNNSPPLMPLLILWLFGLIAWCAVFAIPGESSEKTRRRVSKKKAGGIKDV